MRIALIANPHAGSGRAAARITSIVRALSDRGVEPILLKTSGPGHAIDLARSVVAQDPGGQETTLAVLGGDGTLSEVCQAYIDSKGQAIAGPALALIPSGTGGDTARGLGLSQNTDTVVEQLLTGARRPMDLGTIRLRNNRGEPLVRAFVNVTSMGLTSTVADRINRGPKWLGGKASFYLGTVLGTLGYRNIPISIEVDEQERHRGPVLLVAIANGKYFGGGMKIAPNAEINDGLLDITCIGDISRAKLLSLMPLVYSGRHVSVPEVSTIRGRKVVVRALRQSDSSARVEADGEIPGTLPLQAEILPGALRFVMG